MRNAIEIQREKPDADVDVMEVEGGKLKSRNSNGHRAQRHAQKFKECLVDAYHPTNIRKKLLPVAVLRASKAVALVVNSCVGWMFLGWTMGESKILDFVGMETQRLFARLYGRELNREETMSFLDRRLYWCAVTCSFTVVQIILTLFGFDALTLAISVMLMPVTLLDRQWCALVTRMPSRYNRSQVTKLSVHLSRALSHIATTPGMPTRFGLRGVHTLLGGFELAIAMSQLGSGGFILVFSLWRVLNPGSHVTPAMVSAVVAMRVVKEISNVVSPLIEKQRQPAQFDRNEDCVRQVLHGLSAVATSPMELALRIHEQQESEGEFMASCQTLVAAVTCDGKTTQAIAGEGWRRWMRGMLGHTRGVGGGEGGGRWGARER